MNTEIAKAWIKRADEVLGQQQRGSETSQTAVSMINALYGPRSTQLTAYTAALERISRTAQNAGNLDYETLLCARGAIRAAKAELEGGLVTSVRVLIAGEILAALVSLGKEVLEEKTEPAKNVAAVLIAAAFEDLMRRMGEEFASVAGRPDLQAVIAALKDADVLKGGQIGTAQSYLQFRNHSLHADWEKIDRSQVQSCIGFIEELLVKHFS